MCPDWLHDSLNYRMIALHLCPTLRFKLGPRLEVDGGVIKMTMSMTVILFSLGRINGTIQLARLSP